MKSFIAVLPYLAIAAMGILLYFVLKPIKPHDTIITHRDTTVIIHTDSSKQYQPQPVFNVYIPKQDQTPKIITIPGQPQYIIQPTDTNAIVRDYFTKYHITDTQHLSNATVFIDDTLYRNGIFSRKVKAQTHDTVFKITRDIYYTPTKVFIGIGGAFHFVPEAGVHLGLETPKGKQYELYYHQTLDGQKVIGGSVKTLIHINNPFKKQR